MKRYSAAVASSVCFIGIASLFAPALCQAQGSLPSIKTGGVVSASSFGQFKSIAPGSWIEIYGSNLSINSRSWTGADFSGANAPTSLDGTKVTVGGQAAFIDYISPGQVNAQVPSNVGTGPQAIVATTAAGASAPYTITVNSVQPGLLAPSSFNIAGKQNAVALFSDGKTYVLPPGTISGVTSRRAQPGDTITFYGVGFGPVTPSIPAGQVVQQTNALAMPLQILFGTTPATFSYDGLAPSAVGLYQFNVTVPNVSSGDAVPVAFTVGGVAPAQTLYIAVQSSPPQVQSLSFSNNSVVSGGTVQGTVVLSAAAPLGGAIVALSSNQSAASVPATVTVPAGSTPATFTITAGSVSSNQTATITASYSGSSAQASLTVTPAMLPPFRAIQISFSTPELGMGLIQVFGPPAADGSYGTGDVGAILSPVFGYSAFWNKVTVSGQTLTFSGLVTGSNSYVQSGATIAPITSASLTVTLSPYDASTGEGTVTGGSMTLVSTLATISGSVTGTYVAGVQ
jgi:uncharacterized protein (TIGR03437 family)